MKKIHHLVMLANIFLPLWMGILWSDESPQELVMPAIFADKMVLQREIDCVIWGKSPANAEVEVSFKDQVKTTKANPKGEWSITLNPMKASAQGAPLRIKSGDQENIFKDVLVGEVWFCSGQSNMAFTIKRLLPKGSDDHHPLLKELDGFSPPEIRICNLRVRTYTEGVDDISPVSWDLASRELFLKSSAVATYFAKALFEKVDVPIGLINGAWSSSPIETWVRRDILDQHPSCEKFIKDWEDQVTDWRKDDGVTVTKMAKEKHESWLASVQKKRPDFTREFRAPIQPELQPFYPANLYHGVVASLAPYSLRGILWYQGESNIDRAKSYQEIFPAMIKDWRKLWNHEDLPFYFVQLASFEAPAKDPGAPSQRAELREAQLKTLALPFTGMAVTMDIGDAKDIHPWNKIDAGQRLALLALKNCYGFNELTASGPVFTNHDVIDSAIYLSFEHVGKGLCSGVKSGSEPVQLDKTGTIDRMAIAGKDQKFYWATAEIEDGKVKVQSPEVPNPVAVRYLWEGSSPEGSKLLYNIDGLPASPFRTDDW